MRILRDILAGVHEPQQLTRHRHPCCAKSEAEIAQSLEGDYRAEHLFALRQAVELFDVYTENPHQDEAQSREQAIRQLQRQAQPLGVTVVVEPSPQSLSLI